jgi:hypothetical protein
VGWAPEEVWPEAAVRLLCRRQPNVQVSRSRAVKDSTSAARVVQVARPSVAGPGELRQQPVDRLVEVGRTLAPRARVAAAVIALVVEAVRKIESGATGDLPSGNVPNLARAPAARVDHGCRAERGRRLVICRWPLVPGRAGGHGIPWRGSAR